MEKLSELELRTLYWNFTAWRDKCCDGYAAMGVAAFFASNGLSAHPAT